MAEVVLPKWGVSMREATVLKWHRAVGDHVEPGDPLADLETDKVEMTLEAQEGGTLSRILVEADETVPVGTVLAVIA
jgi:pyruvate/2-oxoglutarate dehydrogenase complex dihydrolipoamide acyltransferase (E2) component